MQALADWVDHRLNKLKRDARWRQLVPLAVAPSGVIDLTHNDYLGFRHDPHLQKQAWSAATVWPIGAGASRLLGGEHKIYQELEESFAHWKGAPSALYFTSGYAANEGLIAALALTGGTFFTDRLIHASLIDGLKLARLADHRRVIFEHNDAEDLTRKLAASAAKFKFIITESLFSMDGDLAPLAQLKACADAHQAILVVDEAHAVGVYGKKGEGLTSEYGLDHQDFISVNPCGKALAAAGALVCGPLWLRDFLINHARSFIFATGASPWVAAALCQIIPTAAAASSQRAWLQQITREIRQQLAQLGLDLGKGNSHIVPIMFGSDQRALMASAFLKDRGIEAKAIRPPTVHPGTARLRLSLHAALTENNLRHIVGTCKELSDGL